MYVGVDKFSSPQVDGGHFLFRERVVDGLIRRRFARMPAIVISAQAGQGKTTVIKQFLDRIGGDSAWYQITSEDADPAFFLMALQACLSNPRIQHAEAAGVTHGAMGGVTRFDLPRRLDSLLERVQEHYSKDLYLVFDDLHNLSGREESLFIINYLVAKAPAKLHFILSSREKVRLEALAQPSGGGNVAILGNRELALDDNELAALFQQAFNISLSQRMTREISLKTDGWIMGALLLGLQMTGNNSEEPPSGWDGTGRSDMREYFRRKVFSPLEPRLHRPLLMLSLLEEIPTALAEGITSDADIGKDLKALAERNIFIRKLNANVSYGLHHLFRRFLREKAAQELPTETITSVHGFAGGYYLRHNNPARALRHFLLAKDMAAIESALGECGLSMLANNQTATLSSILGSIPEADMARMGWASLIFALANMDFAPARALPLLRTALQAFTSECDELGELLCLTHIISIHITTTGHYREGEQLMERAEEIFSGLSDALDPYATILIARSLAMGRCIFLADADTAARYADMALSLARKDHLVNFEAAMLMIMGYISIFTGHLPLARSWMERAFDILPRPEVGTFNCLAIRMMHINFLFHDGDFANYFDQKQQIVEALGKNLVSQTIVGPFCYVWEMDIAINQGRYEDALRIADEAVALDPPLSPHLASQILQLKAVALVFSGSPGKARETCAACEESARLREQAGGLYFITLNKIITGLAEGFLGKREEGVARLSDGIRSARSMPTAYLESTGFIYRAAVRLEQGDLEAAAQDLRAGLGLMRRNAYRHFWACPPSLLEKTLAFAAANGIETDYARKLAAERIQLDFTQGGEPVPFLEIRALGEFSILFKGEPLLPPEALTPGQRELLCMILASPGLKVYQNAAQLYFWPDSSPSAAKANFDTMMSRLRKALAEVLPENSAGRYLVRDRGMVWLASCRVDALDFLAAARNALEHSSMHQHWQAANDFTRADSLWKGDFAPGVIGDDQVRAFRHCLASALTQMALAWGEHLARTNRCPTAITLVEKALRTDPLNAALWKSLYTLHGRQSLLQARCVLARLSALLRAEGYSAEETVAITKEISSSPSYV